MKNKGLRSITYSAIIGAMYVVLTWLSNAVGMSSGAIQLRLGEALTILPYFTPSAIPGLVIGCLISNISMGCSLLDIIVGTVATLLGAIGTSKIKNKYLCPVPPILANTILVPFVIIISYTHDWSLGSYLLTLGGVFAGEVVSVYVFGIILLLAIEKSKIFKR
ncbi:MAG: QueT transporter family protein [Clostridia bacterium]|nr:QueT transporter family protein [Clostridia bacterium]